jgi:hypothetical protein
VLVLQGVKNKCVHTLSCCNLLLLPFATVFSLIRGFCSLLGAFVVPICPFLGRFSGFFPENELFEILTSPQTPRKAHPKGRARGCVERRRVYGIGL